MSQKWLEWAKRLQSISQAGLAFSKDVYDLERYEELRQLSVEIMAEYTDLEMEKITDLFASDTGYQTPKVDVRGVVFHDHKILLVKEKHDHLWSLPGGFCDVGLSPTENIIKEMKEESGFDVTATKLLALLDTNKHGHPPQAYQYYKIFIQCEIIGGSAISGIETNAVSFFKEDELPPLSLNRNTPSQLKIMFQFLHNPHKPAIFD